MDGWRVSRVLHRQKLLPTEAPPLACQLLAFGKNPHHVYCQLIFFFLANMLSLAVIFTHLGVKRAEAEAGVANVCLLEHKPETSL